MEMVEPVDISIKYFVPLSPRDVSVVVWYNQRLVCMINENFRLVLTRHGHMLGPGAIPGR